MASSPANAVKIQTLTDAGCTVRVACAADDNYVMPLAVTLLSAAKNLEPGFDLEVFLLDGNISAANRQRLLDTLADFPVTVHWMREDFSLLDELHISHHISHVAYYRLLLSRILPNELDRILYLDSDLLVLGSLADIWDLSFAESACYAVPDIACPVVDAGAVAKSRPARPYLATQRPIPNYRQLGIPAEAPYFNSGVLLIDLAAWRAGKLCQRFVDCLRENKKHVWCWDQYALNVVLAENWSPLPLQWNQGAHAYEYPSESHSPVSAGEFIAMRDDPKIVHFTTEWKPWHYSNKHPYRNAFFEMLDQTAWSGWRPERPQFSIRRWWQNRAVSLQKQAKITYFKVANAWP
jgi:lipopolysaccharide biosynthesis glycosyltransferase